MRHANSRSHAARDQHGGFTLIETLVAMSVLAVIASVILRDVVSLRADTVWFEDRRTSGAAARSVMATLLADRTLAAGTYHGENLGRAWKAVVSPVNLAPQFAAPFSPKAVGPQDMTPKVTWEPQRLVLEVVSSGRPLRIETIRLARAK